MSLYGVNTDSPDALRTAYAEIERVGARQALRNRLARMREAEARMREAEEAERRQRLLEAERLKAQEAVARFKAEREAAIRRRLSSGKTSGAITREVLDANPDVTLADLTGPSRRQRIVDVRQLVMFRLGRETGLSTTQIGKLLNRDHSTVVYAIHKLAGQSK